MPCHQPLLTIEDPIATTTGYAMAALLVALGIMTILWAAAIPLWIEAAKREREAELVFRGSQYARAISLYQRKYGNADPRV